jgi:DNA-binding CsgD family transcriptional regulator
MLHSLINTVGERYFYNRVICSLQALTPISSVRIVNYSKKARPILLGAISMSEIDKTYCKSAYLLDPVYNVLHKKNNDLIILDTLINDEFYDSIYYNHFYKRVGWSNESNFIIRTNDETNICIAYTIEDHVASLNETNKELNPFLDSIKIAIMTHERVSNIKQKQSSYSDINYNHSLSNRLDTFNLTKREKEIVQLVLNGLSSVAIAEKCFVTEGTIKNHRKNIYRKLGIKSQSELFINFI